MSKMTAESLQVPLNRAKFQKYRKWNITLAVMGLGMVMLSLAGLVFSLYSIFSGTVSDGWMVLNGVLSLWLVVFIGLATAPAWQLANTMGKVMRQNLPVLVVDRDGIIDNSSNYVFGFIPWSEIETVTASSRYARDIDKTFTGIAIVLKNKELLLNKKPPILRM